MKSSKPNISTSTEVRIFKNPTLETLTHTNSFVAISAYSFLAVACLLYAATTYDFQWTHLMLIAGGRGFFTLVEYLMHRFVYHSGEYKSQESWQYKVHGIHHHHPNEESQLAMPIPLALILLGGFFILFYMVLNKGAFFFFPGFAVGYAFYLLMHYLIHVRKAPKGFFKFFWRHHHLHHHKYDDKAFGLSTRFWDRVFGTMPPKKTYN